MGVGTAVGIATGKPIQTAMPAPDLKQISAKIHRDPKRIRESVPRPQEPVPESIATGKHRLRRILRIRSDHGPAFFDQLIQGTLPARPAACRFLDVGKEARQKMPIPFCVFQPGVAACRGLGNNRTGRIISIQCAIVKHSLSPRTRHAFSTGLHAFR